MAFSLDSSSENRIEGVWYNDRTDTQLEIDDHRKGIKVREITRHKKYRWDTYYAMGRGVFDNCDGSVIIVLDRGVIEWRQSRYRRSIVLSRANRYGNFNRDNYYDRDQSRSYNRQSNYGRSKSDYCGDWYCADQRLYLEIREYGDGFRARRPNKEWIYYELDRNGRYRDAKGNYYYFDDSGALSWGSADNNRRFSFSKR
jgi:hypothetical protein